MFILNEGIMSKVTSECYFQSFSTIGTSRLWSKLLPSLKRATRTASELSESIPRSSSPWKVRVRKLVPLQ